MADRSRSFRSWLRFSLRTLFVLLTVCLLALGVIANRVWKQRRLIQLLGGPEAARKVVIYDFQLAETLRSGRPRPPPTSPTERWPRGLVSFLGEDWFVAVVAVDFTFAPTVDERVFDAICEVGTIGRIRFGTYRPTKEQFERIRRALPNVKILDHDLQFRESSGSVD